MALVDGGACSGPGKPHQRFRFDFCRRDGSPRNAALSGVLGSPVHRCRWGRLPPQAITVKEAVAFDFDLDEVEVRQLIGYGSGRRGGDLSNGRSIGHPALVRFS